ncbi:S-methyl-5-thioribose kinase [Paenibacillus polymyxa]|uniref:Methylthioribose kinase n=1 Tax=Paenibacillus polymyxa (strain SC2) TaxID=886882 RepID=E3EIM5_PAEPS|nr:S-methyl-5-thioribose kinase [Paenibacillus polymyxa]ADO55663.1 methylthioribose kinase [Paenibacillus polymyxa SC2]WPQ58407.1 S-methyl-5-thioribose kinase [Paenibacillus polymyxa]CCC84449.1 5-methylthioribose kinase [Paenibacillus polymyxa M1]
MSKYHPLTTEEAIEFVKNIPGFFSQEAQLECREIGDGNLNLVFHITDSKSNKSIIAKQALPYVKIVGESWPLSLDRARIEREALQQEHQLCPELVPAVLGYDDELALTVMEDLSSHTIMRKGLIEGNRYPLFANHIGEFLARTLFFTSDLGMNQQDKKELVKRFINPELCKITEDLILDEPYRFSDNNNYGVYIEDEAEALRTDQVLHLEVALLRERFMTRTEALLHGDLHTGSIFVTAESTKVIDPEFAFYGPMGFDIGAVIANLLLNYAAQPGWTSGEKALKEKRDWLLKTVIQVWEQFESRFRTLWDKHVTDHLARTPGYQDLYLQKVLQDTIGFAGCKVIRRIISLSHVADIDTIADPDIKEAAERLALAIGKALVLCNRKLHSIRELGDIVRTATAIQTKGASRI